MGVWSNIKASLGLQAQLTPSQMTGQRSKSLNKPSDIMTMFNVSYVNDGLCYTDYERMLQDPQIKSGFELIRMFLLSRKLIVVPGSESEEDVQIAEELEAMFDNMSYPMRKIRNDLYTAIIYGYSVGEVIWKMDDTDNKIHIDRIRPIPISTLEDCFRYDDNGDLKEIIQTIDDEEISIPAEKCLVYTYDEKFGDRRGTSILDAVYDNWFMKQKLLKWWNVFLQKHEGPTLIGKVQNPQFKDLFREQLDEIREGRTNMTIGIDDSVDVLETTHRGEGFKEAIDYHDVMIFRKMNIGTMILGQQDGKGAYAQSATQMDTLSIFLDGVHEDVAAELQAKLKELIDMNYTVDCYPTIQFESFEEKDILELVKILDPLIKDMAIDPNDQWFKQLIADVVSRYSDIEMDEYLKEEENSDEGMVKPTPEEMAGPKPDVASDINKIFEVPGKPANEQVQPVKPVGE